MNERLKLLIVDNGQTLDKTLQENQSVRLYKNINAGGAGGFTRGIIEAKNSAEKFSRILLSDDDVELCPESYYRTLLLCDYLKPEFEQAFIHGAMLDLYNKSRFIESEAIQTSDWVRSYHGEKDVSTIHNIAWVNTTPEHLFFDEKQKISSAWWFCCFSMKSVEEKGFPLPVFFQGDDIEWSWRNFGQHHISMNGICVWHAPFEWRVSKIWSYFAKKKYLCRKYNL